MEGHPNCIFKPVTCCLVVCVVCVSATEYASPAVPWATSCDSVLDAEVEASTVAAVQS